MQQQEFSARGMGLEYVKLMRNSFQAWADGTTMMQTQGGKALDLALKQGGVTYEEWQKMLSECTNNSRKATEQFKSTVEENLTRLEEFLLKKE